MAASQTLILGIESSCDETAAAVVRDGAMVLSNVIASQHELHHVYGGVVPEIASRAHLEKILPVIDQALVEAGIVSGDLQAVAVGNRPGLIGSLLVGVSAAKTLAWTLGVPLIGINHVQAHLYASDLQFADQDATPPSPNAAYPALGLVVSGGHTNLYLVHSPLHQTLLGSTLDDAIGEAYDKAAVILEAGYPGGQNLDRLAQQGDARAVDPLPMSMLAPGSLDFSFSGLKTALLYRVRGKPVGKGRQMRFEKNASDLTEAERRNLAAAFQAAAIGAVMKKLQRAYDHLLNIGSPPARLILGGGVSANSLLRQLAGVWAQERSMPLGLPRLSVCVDNAAMIAGLAWHDYNAKRYDNLDLPAVSTV